MDDSVALVGGVGCLVAVGVGVGALGLACAGYGAVTLGDSLGASPVAAEVTDRRWTRVIAMEQLSVETATTPIALPPPERHGAQLLTVEVFDGDRSLGVAVTRFGVGTAGEDNDQDGFAIDQDCDDDESQVHPGLEWPDPNGRDDNCDGRIDEHTVAYDDDGDGLSEEGGDCDDRDARVHPGATETPDCRDEDCDGEIDEGVPVPHQDDAYEQPGGAPLVLPGKYRAFDKDLVFVSRAADDEEAVQFWSDDGLFDDWGIEVTALAMPTGAAYTVTLSRVGGGVVATGPLLEEADSVAFGGSWTQEDSGDYEVRITPVRLVAPYCPIEVSLASR